MRQWLFRRMLTGSTIAGFSLFVSFCMAAEDTAIRTQSVDEAIANRSNTGWCLRLPQDGSVVYRGAVNYDEAGTGTSSMMYPAPNVAGLLAAVITHGLLVDSAKKEQKNKIQATADNVLSPYRGVIDKFNSRDLLTRTVEKKYANDKAKLIENSDHMQNEMIVETMPIFSLTQDQKAIILDNTILIHWPDNAPTSSYRVTSRIISTGKDIADPVAFWTANDGEKLKEESANLVAESIDLAFRYATIGTNKSTEAFQTIRYREGSIEKFERAQMLSNRCDRLLIRTLRGSLMSVPKSLVAAHYSTEEGCDSSGPIIKQN